MFLINLNEEIVACILSFRKSRHKPNLESTSKYGFSAYLGEKNGGVLSMRMQVILDSSFAHPGSAPIWGGKKGEFRDWTTYGLVLSSVFSCLETPMKHSHSFLKYYVKLPSWLDHALFPTHTDRF